MKLPASASRTIIAPIARNAYPKMHLSCPRNPLPGAEEQKCVTRTTGTVPLPRCLDARQQTRARMIPSIQNESIHVVAIENGVPVILPARDGGVLLPHIVGVDFDAAVHEDLVFGEE